MSFFMSKISKWLGRSENAVDATDATQPTAPDAIPQDPQPVPPMEPVTQPTPVQPVGTEQTTQAPDEIVITQQGTALQKVDGDLSLVAYSPEELLLQIHNENNRVDFGMSRISKIMNWYGEIWALIGPIVLLLGTIGEVFIVLWNRQKDQQIWTALSILAVAMVLEGTFLVVSYKSALIRNEADKRPGGRSEQDKKDLRMQLFFWIALACGVCVTQIFFVIAQTKVGDGLDIGGVIGLAVARSVFTLIADAYTAFAHKEMPTTSERALHEKEQRAKHTRLSLDQKINEITTINTAQLALRQAHSEAKIKDEELTTRLDMARLQNKALLDAMVSQQVQSTMMLQTSTGMIRALFDSSMEPMERNRLLTTMSGFMGAVTPSVQQLPENVTYLQLPQNVNAFGMQSANITPDVTQVSAPLNMFSVNLQQPTAPLPTLTDVHPDVTSSITTPPIQDVNGNDDADAKQNVKNVNDLSLSDTHETPKERTDAQPKKPKKNVKRAVKYADGLDPIIANKIVNARNKLTSRGVNATQEAIAEEAGIKSRQTVGKYLREMAKAESEN